MFLILEIARGIAALSVFLYHMKDTLALSLPGLSKIAQFGYLGVPLFFVISGYVITASAEATLKKEGGANAFLKRRFLRIYPPFWASILVVIAIPFVIAAVSALKSGLYQQPEPRYLALSANDWIQLATLTKIFQSANTDLEAEFNQVNSVYWTLAIEFQFYLCMYVALLFRKHFYFIISTITAISLLLVAYPQKLNTGLFIHFWPMFAMGILLYYAIRHGLTLEKLGIRNGQVVGGAMLVSLIATIIALSYLGTLSNELSSYFPSASFGFALLCVGLLWLGAPLEPLLQSAKDGKHLLIRFCIKATAFLGVISYSLYLLHGKILDLPEMFARQVVSTDSVLFPTIIVGGTIALCSVFYTFVEKPFMSAKQQKIYRSALTRTTP